ANGELPINAGMTIRNDSGATVEVRQGKANARVFHVRSAATDVTITGVGSASPITIDGGSVTGANGGGILVDGPTSLSLDYVKVVSNGASADATGAGGSGGGIWTGGDVTLTASTVQGNTSGAGGGGIYAASGIVTLGGGSSVSGNQAPAGVGGGINVDGRVVAVRDGSPVDGNPAPDDGGIPACNLPRPPAV